MTIIEEPDSVDPKPDGGATTAPEVPGTDFDLSPADKRFVGLHLLVAIIALMIGSLMGPLQAFQFSGLDVYPYLEPVIRSYYQGLTLHGVLNALVWTTFFIVGFTNLTTMKGLRRPLSYPMPVDPHLASRQNEKRKRGRLAADRCIFDTLSDPCAPGSK